MFGHHRQLVFGFQRLDLQSSDTDSLIIFVTTTKRITTIYHHLRSQACPECTGSCVNLSEHTSMVPKKVDVGCQNWSGFVTEFGGSLSYLMCSEQQVTRPNNASPKKEGRGWAPRYTLLSTLPSSWPMVITNRAACRAGALTR